MIENEDTDAVGLSHRAALIQASQAAGLVRPGDPIDLNLARSAHTAVELCAGIGGGYFESDGTPGDEIRAVLVRE